MLEETSVYDAISAKYGEMRVDDSMEDDGDGSQDIPPEEEVENEDEQENGDENADEEVPSEDDAGDDDADTAKHGEEVPAKQEERIDTATLLEAGRLGITAEQIEALGSSRALQAAIEMKRSKVQEEDKTKAKETALPERPNFNLDEMDVDDDVKNVLTGIVDYFDQVMNAVTGQLKPIAENLSSQQDAREQQEGVEAEREFDAVMDAEKNFADTFGDKVPQPGTVEFENRKKLFIAFYRLQQADREDGNHTPTKQLVNAAMALAFPDISAKKQEKQLQERLKKRNTMKSNKPAEGKDETIPADKRAIRKVADEFKRRKLEPTYD